MHSFQTQSSSRKLVLAVVLAYIPMMLLAFLGLKIAIVTWLFFEVILLLCLGFCLLLVARNRWEITFEDQSVKLLNIGNHECYRIDNLKKSRLTVKQSSRQKAKNCCDLVISDTVFGIYDVKHCDQLLRYIDQYIPE